MYSSPLSRAITERQRSASHRALGLHLAGVLHGEYVRHYAGHAHSAYQPGEEQVLQDAGVDRAERGQSQEQPGQSFRADSLLELGAGGLLQHLDALAPDSGQNVVWKILFREVRIRS